MDGIIGVIENKLPAEHIKGENGLTGEILSAPQFRWENVRMSALDSTTNILNTQGKFCVNDSYLVWVTGTVHKVTLSAELNQSIKSTQNIAERISELYDIKGAECLQDIEGSFVVIILDKINKSIFIGRDPVGIEPMFYFADNERIIFSSDLNSLKKLINPEINYKYLYTYLRLGSFFREQTPYKNIRELLGGHYIISGANFSEIKTRQWWNVHDFYVKTSNDSFDTALRKTESLLDSVIRNLLTESDREVGSFLSGGIDSGLITSLASKYKPHLKTFTISFSGEYDESDLAKMVADRYNTDHRQIQITFDSLNQDVEKILYNYGEPFFDSSAIPSYYVSKAAKEYVPAILNGDGADELFGGYRKYIPFSKFDFFKSGTVVKMLASGTRKILPPGHQKKSLYNYLFRLVDFSSKSGAEVYLSSGVDIFEGYTQYFTNHPADYFEPVENFVSGINESSLSGLKKLMNLDFDIGLFDDMAVKMNIATKANNLIGLSPFLDSGFLEYVPTLPDNYKIKGKTTKYLLRRLAEKYLPEPLIRQPKRGFEVPLKKWVNNDLKDMIDDYLSSANPLFDNLIARKFVQELMDHKITISEEKRAKILWTLFSMEVWYQKIYKS